MKRIFQVRRLFHPLLPLVFALNFLAVTAVAELTEWEELPVYGGNVLRGVAIDPNNSDHLFAIEGRYAGPFTLMESKNGGVRWEEICRIPGDPGNTGILGNDLIHPDPLIEGARYIKYVAENTIYAGPLRSFDNGDTWEQVYGNYPYWVYEIDPQNNDILYAFRAKNIPYSVNHYYLLKSIDCGDTWTTLTLPFSDAKPLSCFAVHREDPSILMLALRYHSGIYRSTNQGESWVKCDAIADLTEIIPDAVDSSVFYAYSYNGFYRSEDDGVTWTMVYATPTIAFEFVSCVAHPKVSRRIYAMNHNSNLFCRSDDGGNSFSSWSIAADGRGITPYCLAVDNPTSPSLLPEDDILYGGCYRYGPAKSSDGGATWDLANAGMRFLQINDITEDPDDSNILYLSTELGLAKFDMDSAQTSDAFFYLPTHDSISQTIFDHFDSQKMLASDGMDVLTKSIDKGATWTDIGLHKPFMVEDGISTIYPSRVSPNKFLAGNVMGMWKSPDWGETFPRIRQEIYGINVIDSGASSNTIIGPHVLYAGVHDSLYRSKDDGDTWKEIYSLFQDKYIGRCMEVDKQNGNRLFIGAIDFAYPDPDCTRLLRCLDADTSATVEDITPSSIYDHSGPDNWIQDIAIDPTNPSHILFSMKYAIYESFDEGDTWSLFEGGLVNVGPLYFRSGSAESALGYNISSEPLNLTGRLLVSANGGIFIYSGSQTRIHEWRIYK